MSGQPSRLWGCLPLAGRMSVKLIALTGTKSPVPGQQDLPVPVPESFHIVAFSLLTST
jgi:hypothetical protein